VFGRYACTSVALWSDLIVGAFGSGHIRIFSSLKGSLLSEVTAHARWINAIDVAPANGMVCTSSTHCGYLLVKCGSIFRSISPNRPHNISGS